MTAFHKQHRVELKPIEPYVWYPPAGGAPPGLLSSLDPSINEHLLFHGTAEGKVDEIPTQGLGLTRCRDGRYGQGFYFAQEFCKAAQYSRDHNGKGVGKRGKGMAKWGQGKGKGQRTSTGSVLVCRAALGDAHHFKAREPKGRPARDDRSLYDALVVDPREDCGDRQVHSEFVVYEPAQVYVEFVVDFLVTVCA